MTAFDVYHLFLALRLHFTSKYDFFKYQGKTSISTTEQQFEKRPDRYAFHKLAKHNDPHGKIVSVFVDMFNRPSKKIWVTACIDDQSDNIYNDWNKRQQSLTYAFGNDVTKLALHIGTDFDRLIIPTNGQLPPLLQLFRQREISFETVIIICCLAQCQPFWLTKLSDNILYPTIDQQITKYRPFVRFDDSKCTKIIVDCFNDS